LPSGHAITCGGITSHCTRPPIASLSSSFLFPVLDIVAAAGEFRVRRFFVSYDIVLFIKFGGEKDG
jgi:hypothetical protein